MTDTELRAEAEKFKKRWRLDDLCSEELIALCLDNLWNTRTPEPVEAETPACGGRQPSYDTKKVNRTYQLRAEVHPETVARWFLDLKHYWFDVLGDNMFKGQRDLAFRYLCGWIETGEFPPSKTLLEIQIEMKFSEWLGSWEVVVPPTPLPQPESPVAAQRGCRICQELKFHLLTCGLNVDQRPGFSPVADSERADEVWLTCAKCHALRDYSGVENPAAAFVCRYCFSTKCVEVPVQPLPAEVAEPALRNLKRRCSRPQPGEPKELPAEVAETPERHAFNAYKDTWFCKFSMSTVKNHRCGHRLGAPCHLSDDVVDDRFVPFEPASEPKEPGRVNTGAPPNRIWVHPWRKMLYYSPTNVPDYVEYVRADLTSSYVVNCHSCGAKVELFPSAPAPDYSAAIRLLRELRETTDPVEIARQKQTWADLESALKSPASDEQKGSE